MLYKHYTVLSQNDTNENKSKKKNTNPNIVRNIKYKKCLLPDLNFPFNNDEMRTFLTAKSVYKANPFQSLPFKAF